MNRPSLSELYSSPASYAPEGSTSLVVNASLLKTRDPDVTSVSGVTTNGSSRVPEPLLHFGLEVVCSGSASSRTDFFRRRRKTRRSNRRSGRQHRAYIELESESLLSSSESVVSSGVSTPRVTTYDWLYPELLPQMVYVVRSHSTVGVPRILPSSCASRAGLHPKTKPSGSSPSSSQVSTSPAPVMFGSSGVISSPIISVKLFDG